MYSSEEKINVIKKEFETLKIHHSQPLWEIYEIKGNFGRSQYIPEVSDLY